MRGEHFAYAPTTKGTNWHAYLAGNAMWFMVHQPKKTKPCLAVMTNREVECPWCGTDKEVVRRAYVPLYRQVDGAPRCIIVNELYEDALSKFRLHDRLLIGKEEEKGDPVWIMAALTHTPKFQTTLHHRTQPADLTESLLKMWGSAELVKWYRAKFGKPGAPPSVNAVSLPAGTAVGADGRAVSPMMQAAAKRQGFDVIPTDDTDPQTEHDRELLRAVQRGDKPSTNGKGKHKLPPKG